MKNRDSMTIIPQLDNIVWYGLVIPVLMYDQSCPNGGGLRHRSGIDFNIRK